MTFKYFITRFTDECSCIPVKKHKSDGVNNSNLELTSFERELLTEVNVAPAQLHPNSWAFVRAFSILCNHFGHPPTVDVFLRSQKSWEEPLGKLQRGDRKGHPYTVSAILQGFQGEILQAVLL